MNQKNLYQSSNILLPQIAKYPHFLLIDNVVNNLPSNLTYEECYQLAKFLNDHKGILQIEYLELVKLVSLIGVKLHNNTSIFSLNDINDSPKSQKLLRTSRNFPYFTILRNVSEIPISLTHFKLRVLAEYLTENPTISSITYNDLYKMVYPESTTPENIQNKEFVLEKSVLQINNENIFTLTNNSRDSFIIENNDLSCLKNVKDLPHDLEDEEYQRLAEYLNKHSEILKINYSDLLNCAEPRSPKRQKISKTTVEYP